MDQTRFESEKRLHAPIVQKVEYLFGIQENLDRDQIGARLQSIVSDAWNSYFQEFGAVPDEGSRGLLDTARWTV